LGHGKRNESQVATIRILEKALVTTEHQDWAPLMAKTAFFANPKMYYND
jgi:hypothetical protein